MKAHEGDAGEIERLKEELKLAKQNKEKEEVQRLKEEIAEKQEGTKENSEEIEVLKAEMAKLKGERDQIEEAIISKLRLEMELGKIVCAEEAENVNELLYTVEPTALPAVHEIEKAQIVQKAESDY
ncbi:MAG: hypothetical protein FWD89_05280, partial [Firmicutes bacterium]|nr:hypothetical protein [Bacillota bacterium]